MRSLREELVLMMRASFAGRLLRRVRVRDVVTAGERPAARGTDRLHGLPGPASLASTAGRPTRFALIDFDERFRLLAEIDALPEAVRLGQRVAVGWEDHAELTVPVVRRA